MGGSQSTWKKIYSGKNLGYTVTGLSPATTYSFRVRASRYSGATLFTSGWSSTKSAKTNKGSQSAPSAPTIASVTANSITLNKVSGYEYKMGNGSWQSGTTFSGLTAGTSYTFYQRKAATSTLNASPASPGKTQMTATVAPTITRLTSSSSGTNVIIHAECDSVKGATLYQFSWRKSGGTWRDEPASKSPKYTISDSSLTFGTEYQVRVRASNDSVGVYTTSIWSAAKTITTVKGTQPAPTSPPGIADVTANSITLNKMSGYEYRMGESGTWKSDPTFGDLTEGTSYTFYQRKAETSTLNASPPSPGRVQYTRYQVPVITTGVGNDNYQAWINVSCNNVGAAEYEWRWRRLGDNLWKTSPVGTGNKYRIENLSFGTLYEIQVRALTSPYGGPPSSEWSKSVYVTTPTVAPPLPSSEGADLQEFNAELWNDGLIKEESPCYLYALNRTSKYNHSVYGKGNNPNVPGTLYIAETNIANLIHELTNGYENRNTIGKILSLVYLDAKVTKGYFAPANVKPPAEVRYYPVALVWGENGDFHWYRMDKDSDNGKNIWSDKNGMGKATQYDASNEKNYDPFKANRNYSDSSCFEQFVGYYYVGNYPGGTFVCFDSDKVTLKTNTVKMNTTDEINLRDYVTSNTSFNWEIVEGNGLVTKTGYSIKGKGTPGEVKIEIYPVTEGGSKNQTDKKEVLKIILK